MGSNFYLVTTDHLNVQIWFRDDEDFRIGMNYVAITARDTDVSILAFILMSNHVHFVLSCSRQNEAMDFINEFKRRYSFSFFHRHGKRKMLHDNNVDIKYIEKDGEALERAIAYVQMNSVAARICAFPNEYRWGTGPCFFRQNPIKTKSLKELSARKRYSLLHTKAVLSDNWQITEEGYILPDSYVPVVFVEKLFRSTSRMLYFLRNSSKAKIVLESENTHLPSFKDQTLVVVIQDLCQSVYRKSSLDELNDRELVDLLHQLRRRTGSDLKQLGRVLGLQYERLVQMLE